jgi:hypothetical protein
MSEIGSHDPFGHLKHTWEFRDKMTFGCGPRGEAENIL